MSQVSNESVESPRIQNEFEKGIAKIQLKWLRIANEYQEISE